MSGRNSTTTIRRIMDDIMSHPMMADIPFDTVVRHTAAFINIMGAPILYDDKQADIKVEEWRALLPCDFLSLKQVMLKDGETVYDMHSSTSSFQPSDRFRCGDKLTYKLRGNVIYTSVKECELKIAYLAMKLDDEGLPLILNDESFIRALESYIKKQWFTILFDTGRINANVLMNAQREYSFNVAQAGEKLSVPDGIETYENIGRILNSYIIPVQANKNAFSGLSNQIVKNN